MDWPRAAPGYRAGRGYGQEFGETANEYPSGFAELANQLATFAAARSQFQASDYLGTVKGETASTIPYQPERGVPGSVEFSFNGVRIVVYGNLTREVLLSVAESVI